MAKQKISNERGAPTLEIGGKRVSPVVYCLSDFPGARSNTAYAQTNIKNFGEKGVFLIGADTGLHLGWHKETEFDPAPLREEISAVLDANPEARILLRLHVNPPYWWLRDHPRECVVYRKPDGDIPGIDNGEHPRLIDGDNKHKYMRASIASRVWLREACEKIRLFLTALEGTRELEALLAVQVAYGVNGEWHQWGTDVSGPMCAYFKEYIKRIYGTEDALRQAWNDPEVTIETAQYHPEVTEEGDEGCLLDPQKSRRAIDAKKCNQNLMAETILALCRTVKQCAPQLLCGVFYGYQLGMGEKMTISGHLCVDKLYEAEGVVDFLCGPYAYLENRKSDQVPMQRALLESHRLNGMLWLTEMDDSPVGTAWQEGGDPAFREETFSRMRRETLQPVLGGHGFWFYDHRIVERLVPPGHENSIACSIYRKKGWWDAPDLMEEVERIRAMADKVVARPYQPAADVLVVYDTESYYYRQRILERSYVLHHAIARTGVVFDYIYAKDLERCDLQRYKCVIFVNSFVLTPERRKQVRKLTEGMQRVFLSAFGYCDGERLSEDNISAAVGMTVKKLQKEQPGFTLTFDPAQNVEMQEGSYPVFAVEDPEAQVLGRFPGGEVACACKGKDVYVAAQELTPALAAYLLERAGVHRWCDSGEPILAGSGFVAINCQRAGQRTLTLPGGKNITVTARGYATYVYDMQTGEQVL